MVENPTPGLSMVPGDVPVTVTREEHHQGALSRYDVVPGRERHIAAELARCVIGAGKYKGERGIEVRVDGQRVGELTHMMSRRYAPLLAVAGRVGCEAVVSRDERGLQVTLHLPRDAATAFLAPPAPEPPTERFTPLRPAPAAVATVAAAAAAARPVGFGWQKPLGIVAVVVAFLFLLGAIFHDSDEDPPRSSSTADLAAEAAATTTVEPSPTTTTTTTTTTTPPPPPPTTTEVVVAPPVTQPPPVTQEPPPPAPAPPPVPPKPKPQPACDPNYSGCVPIASDVDCAGGSGNGPAYASGPIRVTGSDIYGLDNDGDGIACE